MTDNNLQITTWNVNSLRVRLEQVMAWLEAQPCQMLAIQETKTQDEQFPIDAFEAAGLHVVFHGQKTYNGVAIVSRSEASDVVHGIPGFEDPQARVIAASYDDIRLINCYVPNGQSLESDKYIYKLKWLSALRDYLVDSIDRYPQVIVVGDFNIAPRPEDTHDPDKWEGNILCSDPERAAFTALLETGLEDVWLRCPPDDARFTWWDYRAAGFRRNAGLRIDHLLATPELADSCVSVDVDKIARSSERPSDHAPVSGCFVL